MSDLILSAYDQETLAGLTPADRDKAFALDRRFSEVGKPREVALRALAAEWQTEFRTLQSAYYEWRKIGIMACVDRRRCPTLWKMSGKRARVLPREVIEFWKGLQLEFQRDTSLRACYRKFISLWREGKVPGLPADCELNPHTGVPYGCHFRNLSREKFRLTDYQAKAIRIGKHSASALLPKVLTSRVGLLAGQRVEFDDQEHDVQVAFPGVNKTLTRPAGFHSLDSLSGCDTLQSYKPALLNFDGSLQKLRQIDFEWFVVAYLTQIGYRADTGTEFIWELGTSKAGSLFVERMHRATNDKITVRASGLNREPALAGLFHGPAKGNPRVKGARECWFRLFREESAALPAPTGQDRDHAPEGKQALEREARMLLAAMRALPPQRAELLQLPCLTWVEYVAAADMIVRLINSRTWHSLEGWEEMSFMAHEWRFALDAPWLSQQQYLGLPDAQKQLFQGMLRQTPELWQTRRLSPAEVWEARRSELTRVSGAAIPILFGPEHARAERVESDLSIVIQDREISPTPLVYDAVLTNGRHLTRRQNVAVYLNPFAPDTLQVCDENLRWLGTAERVQRLCKMDSDGALRRYNKIRQIAADELAPVARMGARITQRETERLTNNARALDKSRPFTAEEKLAERERRQLAQPMTAFLTEDGEDPHATDDEPQIASMKDFGV
jgi:hypothetical protein